MVGVRSVSNLLDVRVVSLDLAWRPSRLRRNGCGGVIPLLSFRVKSCRLSSLVSIWIRKFFPWHAFDSHIVRGIWDLRVLVAVIFLLIKENRTQ